MMKKRYRVVLTFLVCSSIVILLALIRTAFGDKTVLTHDIDDSCTVQVRTDSIWEYSIPVYLKIVRKGRKTLKSVNFYYYDPEEIESKELRLEIHKVDNLIFIHRRGDPVKILALVDLEDDLVYPHKGGKGPEEIELYYVKVQNLFSRLKKFLKNDELKLAGYPEAPK